LRAIAAEALAPWVKVGNTVFRASTVHDDGRNITVVARVRDDGVAASLLGRRPEVDYGRNSETRITWPGGTSPVQVRTVAWEMTSSRARVLTLTAERKSENRSNLLELSLNGMTPDDLTQLAARVVLLGEPNPLDRMSFMVNGTNPLQALEGVRLPEDSVEPVGRLLVTELLVGERGVGHLTSFRLGPQRSGQRRLRLSWMPRRRYVNAEPIERLIEGETTRLAAS
jgi:hypothetical protein